MTNLAKVLVQVSYHIMKSTCQKYRATQCLIENDESNCTLKRLRTNKACGILCHIIFGRAAFAKCTVHAALKAFVQYTMHAALHRALCCTVHSALKAFAHHCHFSPKWSWQNWFRCQIVSWELLGDTIYSKCLIHNVLILENTMTSFLSDPCVGVAAILKGQTMQTKLN